MERAQHDTSTTSDRDERPAAQPQDTAATPQSSQRDLVRQSLLRCPDRTA